MLLHTYHMRILSLKFNLILIQNRSNRLCQLRGICWITRNGAVLISYSSNGNAEAIKQVVNENLSDKHDIKQTTEFNLLE